MIRMTPMALRYLHKFELSDDPGVRFHAGQGVGTVTRSGLSLAVGEAAINPVPRKNDGRASRNPGRGKRLRRRLRGYYRCCSDGERIALKTMNGRLGILGGLSILGTTGIVRPYSCSAFIASIHQSIDVAHANGIEHIAAATGSTSEDYIQSRPRS